jgi:hypothetical protein
MSRLVREKKNKVLIEITQIGAIMNLFLKRTFLPSLIATSLFSATLLPAKPAAADEKVLRDVGIGAAAGAVTGAITGKGSVFTHAVNGAAAGAAVNGANGIRRTSIKGRKNRNVVQDIGVGAGAGVVSGALTNRRHTGNNAITGAAAGAAIHLLTK